MPELDREAHEKLLSELLNPEIDAPTKTDILTKLRDNYTGFTTEYETAVKDKEKLKQDNDALIVSNSKLFRQTGILEEPKPKDEVKKEFSQTIKISDIEKTIK